MSLSTPVPARQVAGSTLLTDWWQWRRRSKRRCQISRIVRFYFLFYTIVNRVKNCHMKSCREWECIFFFFDNRGKCELLILSSKKRFVMYLVAIEWIGIELCVNELSFTVLSKKAQIPCKRDIFLMEPSRNIYVGTATNWLTVLNLLFST